MRLALLWLAACTTPHHFVEWGGANHFASEHLALADDGTGHFELSHADGTRIDRRTAMSPKEIADLQALLRSQHACGLVSNPSYQPVPDESQTTLRIDLQDLRCTVVLWDGEWSKRTDSTAIDAAIRTIITRAQR